MISASSIFAVLAGLSVFSEEVRGPLTRILGGDAADVSAMALRTQDFWHALTRAATDYAAANRPLVGFGVVAVVLAILMFRT